MVSPGATGGDKMFRICAPCECKLSKINSKCPAPKPAPAPGPCPEPAPGPAENPPSQGPGTDPSPSPAEPTDEECQIKTSKNGCVERGCGFNEKTGKCNKRCDKFAKAECPAKRCRVNKDKCETEPTDEECQTKTSKNGCVERGCGFNEKTGKCNKRCDKFAKAECP